MLDITLPSRRIYFKTSKSLPKLKLRPNGICNKEEDEELPVPLPLALPTVLSIVDIDYPSQSIDVDSQMCKNLPLSFN